MWWPCRAAEKLEVLARQHQVCANTLRRRRDEFVAAGRDRLTRQADAADAAALDNSRLAKELTEREWVSDEITLVTRLVQRERAAHFERRRTARVEQGHASGRATAAVDAGAGCLAYAGDAVPARSFQLGRHTRTRHGCGAAWPPPPRIPA